jgi:hypothetical protein
MKEFPRFSEAHIQHTLTQLETELVLMVLSHFRESLNTRASTDLIKSLLSNAKQLYEFDLADDYLKKPKTLKLHLELMLDDLMDAYCLERFKYLDVSHGYLHEAR